MQAYMKSIDMTGVTKANPAEVQVPAFDLDHLKLREADGNLRTLRIQALFTVVAAYWEHTPKLALKTGLVAGLWRHGMPAPDIIRSIAVSTGKDGQLIKSSSCDSDMIHVIIDAYFASKDRPTQSELSQADAKEMLDRLLAATRSAVLGSKDVANTVLHRADLRRLGLIDNSGKVDLDRVKKVAEQVFSVEKLSFDDLAAWVDENFKSVETSTNDVTKKSQAMLKKKRKQGRLNRKRGRQ
ncbi:hypothetical protein Q4577_11800 [Marinovum sp. 2_MG-2023]|nr:hypothetical protein [Marinovum sp. 2_MG-2023]MDO6780090.1 hypothetical protein [Marinovum sp. 1_MG-2023]